MPKTLEELKEDAVKWQALLPKLGIPEVDYKDWIAIFNDPDFEPRPDNLDICLDNQRVITPAIPPSKTAASSSIAPLWKIVITPTAKGYLLQTQSPKDVEGSVRTQVAIIDKQNSEEQKQSLIEESKQGEGKEEKEKKGESKETPLPKIKITYLTRPARQESCSRNLTAPITVMGAYKQYNLTQEQVFKQLTRRLSATPPQPKLIIFRQQLVKLISDDQDPSAEKTALIQAKQKFPNYQFAGSRLNISNGFIANVIRLWNWNRYGGVQILQQAINNFALAQFSMATPTVRHNVINQVALNAYKFEHRKWFPNSLYLAALEEIIITETGNIFQTVAINGDDVLKAQSSQKAALLAYYHQHNKFPAANDPELETLFTRLFLEQHFDYLIGLNHYQLSLLERALPSRVYRKVIAAIDNQLTVTPQEFIAANITNPNASVWALLRGKISKSLSPDRVSLADRITFNLFPKVLSQLLDQSHPQAVLFILHPETIHQLLELFKKSKTHEITALSQKFRSAIRLFRPEQRLQPVQATAWLETMVWFLANISTKDLGIYTPQITSVITNLTACGFDAQAQMFFSSYMRSVATELDNPAIPRMLASVGSWINAFSNSQNLSILSYHGIPLAGLINVFTLPPSDEEARIIVLKQTLLAPSLELETLKSTFALLMMTIKVEGLLIRNPRAVLPSKETMEAAIEQEWTKLLQTKRLRIKIGSVTSLTSPSSLTSSPLLRAQPSLFPLEPLPSAVLTTMTFETTDTETIAEETEKAIPTPGTESAYSQFAKAPGIEIAAACIRTKAGEDYPFFGLIPELANLPPALIRILIRNTLEALQATCDKMLPALLAQQRKHVLYTTDFSYIEKMGSTLHIQLILPATIGYTLISVNCGDSYGDVDIGNPFSLKKNLHESGQPEEHKRLETLGFLPPHSQPKLRLGGDLGVSGSLGDNYFLPYGLTQSADIQQYSIPSTSTVVFHTYTDGCEHIRKEQRSKILQRGRLRYAAKEYVVQGRAAAGYFKDDASVVLLKLKPHTRLIAPVFIGVADGHGGFIVAKTISDHFLPFLREEIAAYHLQEQQMKTPLLRGLCEPLLKACETLACQYHNAKISYAIREVLRFILKKAAVISPLPTEELFLSLLDLKKLVENVLAIYATIVQKQAELAAESKDAKLCYSQFYGTETKPGPFHKFHDCRQIINEISLGLANSLQKDFTGSFKEVLAKASRRIQDTLTYMRDDTLLTLPAEVKLSTEGKGEVKEEKSPPVSVPAIPLLLALETHFNDDLPTLGMLLTALVSPKENVETSLGRMKEDVTPEVYSLLAKMGGLLKLSSEREQAQTSIRDAVRLFTEPTIPVAASSSSSSPPPRPVLA